MSKNNRPSGQNTTAKTMAHTGMLPFFVNIPWQRGQTGPVAETGGGGWTGAHWVLRLSAPGKLQVGQTRFCVVGASTTFLQRGQATRAMQILRLAAGA